MRIRFLLLAILLMAVQLGYSSLDSNLLKKRWKITSHTKKSKSIPHHPDDFIQLNSKSNLEKVTEGTYFMGTWNFNPATNSLTINTADGSLNWTVAELTAKKMKVTQNNEIWEFESVLLPTCSGDPYDDLTIICGKWKVADHIFNYSRVPHTAVDYLQFFPDGSAEKVYKGKYSKMTWKYEDGKIIFSDATWNIKKLDPKQLNAETQGKKESFILKKS